MRRDIKSLVVTMATLSSFMLIAITVTFTSIPHGGVADFYETSRDVSLN